MATTNETTEKKLREWQLKMSKNNATPVVCIAIRNQLPAGDLLIFSLEDISDEVLLEIITATQVHILKKIQALF